jgi:hypothetical protein
MDERKPERSVRARLLALLFVAACVVGSAWWRIDAALSIPEFDVREPVGLLKSDPALLYHFAQRIAGEGGLIPRDFSASKDVQYPDVVDLRVEFPMGQPWLAANLWLLTGQRQPLHVFCTWLFAILAALAGVGVYGLARELGADRLLAGAALLVWVFLPASYRTTGFVLLGEDLSFPLLAVHLWLLARAARVRTPLSFALAGAFLVGGLATWHAAGFFVALEAAAFFAWYLRSGENPLAARHAWIVPACVAAACLVDPMLRGKLQILSLPMQLALALLVMAAVERRRRLAPWARIGAALAAFGALLLAGVAASRIHGGGLGDYSHVFGLLLVKLRYLGRLPDDPGGLPFEVRILWQGPFETTAPGTLWRFLGVALFGLAGLLFTAAPAWWRGRDRSGDAVLAVYCLESLVFAWLIFRMLILAAFLFPVAGAVALVRAPRGARMAVGGAAVVFAAAMFPLHTAGIRNPRWYDPLQRQEIAALVDAVRRLVPPGAAVASDEVTSTPILAHTGHPILVQPKFEWAAARARLEEFRMAALRGSPADLAAVLRRHGCRYLAFDWHMLWSSRAQAGIPRQVVEPEHGSVLYGMAVAPEKVPGFKLLWRSSLPSDHTRLYELAESGP